jgi:flagellar biosynthetic protein FliR
VRALDLFAPGTAAVVVLFAARLTGLMLVAPMFSARTVPAAVRAALLIVLTALLAPVARAHAGAAELTPAAAMGEMLVGFAMGLGAALLVGAAEAAGDMMTIQIGLSGAALMDPLSNQQVPVLGNFAQLLALTLLLTLDAHHVMLDALAASTRYIPVGSPVDAPGGAAAALSAAGSLFALGLRFAAPVVAAVMIANVALAVLGRAAPTLNVLALAFPVQIALGLVALAAAIPLIGAWYTGWADVYDAMLTTILRAFAGAAPGGAR